MRTSDVILVCVRIWMPRSTCYQKKKKHCQVGQTKKTHEWWQLRCTHTHTAHARVRSACKIERPTQPWLAWSCTASTGAGQANVCLALLLNVYMDIYTNESYINNKLWFIVADMIYLLFFSYFLSPPPLCLNGSVIFNFKKKELYLIVSIWQKNTWFLKLTSFVFYYSCCFVISYMVLLKKKNKQWSSL